MTYYIYTENKKGNFKRIYTTEDRKVAKKFVRDMGKISATIMYTRTPDFDLDSVDVHIFVPVYRIRDAEYQEIFDSDFLKDE